MEFDINVGAGLLAGLAAMIPGSIIYSPMTAIGKRWMKEMEAEAGKQKKKQAFTPIQAMSLMLLTSLISGLIASAVVSTTGAGTVMDAIDVCLLLVWFPISVNLSQTFFENRSRVLCGIAVLNQVLTFAVIGTVLGLSL